MFVAYQIQSTSKPTDGTDPQPGAATARAAAFTIGTARRRTGGARGDVREALGGLHPMRPGTGAHAPARIDASLSGRAG
jgi:hypothetical protein